MAANIDKYDTSFVLSQDYFNKLKISVLPIDMLTLLNELGIFVSSLSEYRCFNPTSRLEIKDARCYYDIDSKTYLILYNDKNTAYRINFSLAHEFAHIALGHLNNELTELSRGGLSDPLYFKMEGEANVFAGNFLAPPILINEKLKGQPFSVPRLQPIFALSEPALNDYRKPDYLLWINRSRMDIELQILNRCGDSLYPHTCSRCNVVFYGEEASYCPICAYEKFTNYRKGDKAMRYEEGIDVDDTGKALCCPVCDNTEISSGYYCQICGTNLVNECTVCDDFDAPRKHVQNGNARYCTWCGSPTTFYKRGFLKDWQEV